MQKITQNKKFLGTYHKFQQNSHMCQLAHNCDRVGRRRAFVKLANTESVKVRTQRTNERMGLF